MKFHITKIHIITKRVIASNHYHQLVIIVLNNKKTVKVSKEPPKL